MNRTHDSAFCPTCFAAAAAPAHSLPRGAPFSINAPLQSSKRRLFIPFCVILKSPLPSQHRVARNGKGSSPILSVTYRLMLCSLLFHVWCSIQPPCSDRVSDFECRTLTGNQICTPRTSTRGLIMAKSPFYLTSIVWELFYVYGIFWLKYCLSREITDCIRGTLKVHGNL